MMLWRALVFLGAGAVLLLLFVAVGQPLFTDDLWWHLALGERYAASGPWLESDPFLFTASGPPAPAAWLADVLFYAVQSLLGFQGLRGFHIALVALLLYLVFGIARRTSGGSSSVGLVVVALFAVLGAYRLIQLRPHLFTMLGALLVFRLAIEPRMPSWRRVAGVVMLFGAWVNLHAGFLLGPLMLAAATGGVAGQLLLERGARRETRARLLRMGAGLALGLLATLANPGLARPHLLYFAAGGASPELGGVRDEWSPAQLFALPVANLPPSLLSWFVLWCVVLALFWVVGRALDAWRREGSAAAERDASLDPAGIALALVSLAGMLVAVRFLWLGLFVLLPLVAAWRGAERLGSWRMPALAFCACALAPGFFFLGDWPMISRAVELARYSEPYRAAKWNAHAVWWLSDVGLEGNLFNTYSYGNFLGYWLSPDVRVYLNGSLNVPKQTMADYGALLRRAPAGEDVSFLDSLDRQNVDLFLGTGLARIPDANRATEYTTTHLENADGWVLVFRNLRNAVYLRDTERNRENLARVEAYYEVRKIHFDVAQGFDPIAAIESSPGWAHRHGLLAGDLRTAQATLRSQAPERRRIGLARLASIYAALGAYDRAVLFDRQQLEIADNVQAARRLVWSLLHARRFDEAVEAAEVLREVAAPADGLSRGLADAAERIALETDPTVVDGTIAGLPLLTPSQTSNLMGFFREPAARPSRDRAEEKTGE
jgi:hypothetical protein